MADELYFLTKRDRDNLNELDRLVRGTLKSLQRQSSDLALQNDFLSPEVYVAVSPAGGIPSLGFADCQIYRADTQGNTAAPVLVAVVSVTKRVYNFSGVSVGPAATVPIVRDKFGVWMVLGLTGAGGGGGGSVTGVSPMPFRCGPCCASMPSLICGTVCTSTDPKVPKGTKFLLHYLTVQPPAIDPGACSPTLDTGTGTGTSNLEPCLPPSIPAWIGVLPDGGTLSLVSNDCGCVLGYFPKVFLGACDCTNVGGMILTISGIGTDGGGNNLSALNGTWWLNYEQPVRIINPCLYGTSGVSDGPVSPNLPAYPYWTKNGSTPMSGCDGFNHCVTILGNRPYECAAAQTIQAVVGASTNIYYNFNNAAVAGAVATITPVKPNFALVVAGGVQPSSSANLVPCCTPFVSGPATLQTSGGTITVELIDCGGSGGGGSGNCCVPTAPMLAFSVAGVSGSGGLNPNGNFTLTGPTAIGSYSFPELSLSGGAGFLWKVGPSNGWQAIFDSTTCTLNVFITDGGQGALYTKLNWNCALPVTVGLLRILGTGVGWPSTINVVA